MRFAVEAWAPEYGAAMGEGEGGLVPTEVTVDVDVEVPMGDWRPLDPPAGTPVPDTVLFVDGVRRIDARVWIHAGGGRVRPGVCASYAAGAVRCDDRATVVDARVARGLFCACPDAEGIVAGHGTWEVRPTAGDLPEELALGVQHRMGELEVETARAAAGADLVVVDGPLTGRQDIAGAVGYVKTHRVAYLPAALESVVGALRAGQRTPVFLTTGSWSRWSWYLRLAEPDGHPWDGVVRGEVAADGDVAAAGERADVTAALLPRFRSERHKDGRAPQNLYPIAGLERELRRRLGDAELLYRSLRQAARRLAA